MKIAYAEKQDEYKQNLFSFDQRYNDIFTQSEAVRVDRERKKLELKRFELKLT